jgi:tripartite-type tricarboxylate transporter receptor subunit TctC
MSMLHRSCLALSALFAASLYPAFASADTLGLPAKPVRIIVPNAAAGPNDLVGRLIAPKLSETLAQPVIVDNRPSANGVIGSELVARAAPDGTTLAVGNSGTHAVNATLYKKPSYDPIRDFAPITEVIFAPLVLAANPSVAAASVKDLIAEAKRAPGKLNFAVAGATGEIAGNLIKLQGQCDITNVPYKGGAPAMQAVIANESQLVLTLYSSLKGAFDAGRLKPLGVTSAKRDPQIPNVPTIAESGLPGYEVEFWVGVFAPAKTPPKVVHALNRELVRIINLPDVKKGFVNVGYEVVGDSPEHFAQRVKRDTDKFRKTILDSKMQQLD